MENFFKQFRDNLERRPQPAFEERDWRGLEKRLEQQGEKRPAALAWWWLVWPFLLLSLGANGLLYSKLKISRQQVAVREIQRDTVFQTQVMLMRDTVYQIRVVEVRRSGDIPMYPAFSQKTSDKSDNPGQFSESRLLVETPDNTQPYLSESLPTASETPSTLPTLLPSTLHPLPSAPSLPEIPIEPVVSKQKKTLQYHLYVLRPKGFQLGVAGGWAYPFSEGLAKQGGYSAGLEAGVEFTPNLRLWAGATYFNVRYVADRMGDDIGIPPVAPPSDDFTFVEAEAPQPSLEYMLGMQYVFNIPHTFRPFLGVGYGAVSLLPYEVVYDFENQPLGIEWSFEKTVSRNEFLTNMLLLRAGFEFKMSKNWNWLLRANYRTQLGKTGFQSPDMLGIQAGLTHRF